MGHQNSAWNSNSLGLLSAQTRKWAKMLVLIFREKVDSKFPNDNMTKL